MKKKYKYTPKLHVFRAEYRLTQKQLGDELGLTRQTISNIEKFQEPTLLNATKIAIYFGVQIEDIFSFEEVSL